MIETKKYNLYIQSHDKINFTISKDEEKPGNDHLKNISRGKSQLQQEQEITKLGRVTTFRSQKCVLQRLY